MTDNTVTTLPINGKNLSTNGKCNLSIPGRDLSMNVNLSTNGKYNLSIPGKNFYP